MGPIARGDPANRVEKIAPRRVALFGLLLFGASSCTPAPTPASSAAIETEREKLHDGPLTDYVPAAGLRWLLLARPRELARDRALMQALAPLLPASRIETYRRSTGVDLLNLNSALVAGFDLGTLYLAEDHGDLEPVELAFRERLVAEVSETSPHPALTRVSGVVGRTPQGLLLYDGHMLAASVGDPTLLKIVEAFARNKLRRAVVALRGAALSRLADFSEGAPLRFFVPGPFEDRWMLAAEGLLAAADGVALAVTPRGAERVAVGLAIEGPWDETREVSPAEKLRLAWEGLASSSTGKLFGLDAPLTPPTIENTDTRVTLTTELALQPIVAGLHAAVSAEISEILGPSERSR